MFVWKVTALCHFPAVQPLLKFKQMHFVSSYLEKRIFGWNLNFIPGYLIPGKRNIWLKSKFYTRIFSYLKKNIWLKSKFYTRISYTWISYTWKRIIWLKSKFYTRISYIWIKNIWLTSFEQTILSKEIFRSIWRLHILAFQFLLRNRSLHLFLRKGKKVISKQLSGYIYYEVMNYC